MNDPSYSNLNQPIHVIFFKSQGKKRDYSSIVMLLNQKQTFSNS